MTFTVTYREKDGTRAEIEIEAANRAACLSECKARGITPMGVREGRSRRAVGASPKQKLFTLRFYLFVAIAAIAAIALWWWLGGRGETARPAEKPAIARPSREPRSVPTSKSPATVPQSPAPKAISTNAQPSDAVSPSQATEENPPRKLTMAERGIRVAKPRKELRPRRFKYNAEEHIAFFLETEPGDIVFGEIPYGPKFVEDFKASLLEPVAVLPDDSEDVRQLKRSVQEMKEELKAKMDAGEDIAKIMRDARRQLVELGNYRTSLEDELKRIARGGEFNEEEFGKFVGAANKMLEAKGLSPIQPTRMMYKMLELKARRINRK